MKNRISSLFLFFFLFIPVLSVYSQVASWQPLNGPFGGGRVNKLVVDDSLIYAGTQTGLYKMPLSGTTWTHISNGLPDKSINDIAIDNSNIYVGITGSRIYRSLNNGSSWSAVNMGIQDTAVNCIMVSDSLLFAGTSFNGLFASADDGLSWTPVPAFDSMNVVNLNKYGNNLYVAASIWGTQYFELYVSNDNGNSWTLLTSDSVTVTSVAADSSRILITTNGDGVILSTDSGSTWNYVFTGGYYRAAFINSGDLFVSPYGGPVKRSSDNGITWVTFNTGLPSYISLFSFSSNANVLFAGSYGAGVLQSTDNGTTWTSPFTGMKGNITSVVSMGNNIYAGTLGDGLFWSSNGGQLWNRSNIGLDDPFIESLALFGTTIYAGTRNGLYRSVNFGITWDSVPGLMSNGVNVIKVYGNDIYLGRTYPNYLMHSSDGGITWSGLSSPVSSACRSFSKKDNYIVTSGTWQTYPYYSVNYGVNWTNGITTSTIFCSAFTTSKVLVGGSSIWGSNLAGTSWSQMSTGLPAGSWFNTMISDSNTVYTGGYQGIFSSYNEGSNWYNISSGLDYLFTNCLFQDASSLYAATENGVWKMDINTVIQELELIPNINVYPNPSYGSFQIICNGINDKTRLEIIDSFGRIIQWEYFYNAGNYKITLSDFKSGFYIIRLINNEKMTSKKIIIN